MQQSNGVLFAPASPDATMLYPPQSESAALRALSQEVRVRTPRVRSLQPAAAIVSFAAPTPPPTPAPAVLCAHLQLRRVQDEFIKAKARERVLQQELQAAHEELRQHRDLHRELAMRLPALQELCADTTLHMERLDRTHDAYDADSAAQALQLEAQHRQIAELQGIVSSSVQAAQQQLSQVGAQETAGQQRLEELQQELQMLEQRCATQQWELGTVHLWQQRCSEQESDHVLQQQLLAQELRATELQFARHTSHCRQFVRSSQRRLAHEHKAVTDSMQQAQLGLELVAQHCRGLLLAPAPEPHVDEERWQRQAARGVKLALARLLWPASASLCLSLALARWRVSAHHCIRQQHDAALHANVAAWVTEWAQMGAQLNETLCVCEHLLQHWHSHDSAPSIYNDNPVATIPAAAAAAAAATGQVSLHSGQLHHNLAAPTLLTDPVTHTLDTLLLALHQEQHTHLAHLLIRAHSVQQALHQLGPAVAALQQKLALEEQARVSADSRALHLQRSELQACNQQQQQHQAILGVLRRLCETAEEVGLKQEATRQRVSEIPSE